MKKIDILALSFIVMLAIVFPLSAIYMQNSKNDYIIARTPENGNWSVDEIKVKLGESIELSIISDDVTHSFMIEEYDLDVELYPGKVVKINIEATIEGEFTFKCFVYCSPTHKKMTGKFIVYA